MKQKQIPQNKIAELHEKLEALFDFAPPASLRKSIYHVFFNYLLEKDKVFPKDFETIVSDFYFLMLFLQEAEDAMVDKPAPG